MRYSSKISTPTLRAAASRGRIRPLLVDRAVAVAVGSDLPVCAMIQSIGTACISRGIQSCRLMCRQRIWRFVGKHDLPWASSQVIGRRFSSAKARTSSLIVIAGNPEIRWAARRTSRCCPGTRGQRESAISAAFCAAVPPPSGTFPPEMMAWPPMSVSASTKMTESAGLARKDRCGHAGRAWTR